MQQEYRTYMEVIPEKFKELFGSCFNRPSGGLWGCRGDEWKNFVETKIDKIDPEYPKERLNKCFKWKLKEGTNVYTIDNFEDFAYLVENYFRKVRSKPIGEINFLKLAKEYDAVEVTQNAIYELKEGTKGRYCGLTYQYPIKLILYKIGLRDWDVPSICVFKPNETVAVLP